MGRHELPAGRYYVGDPCYVINDWTQFCEVWFAIPDGEKGVFKLFGEEVCVFPTQYGDGAYETSDGDVLGVDAGLIGVIPEALIMDGYHDGAEVHFDQPFQCSRDDDGLLHFGSLTVMTGDEDEEDDDD